MLVWKDDRTVTRSFDQAWYTKEAFEEARTAYAAFCHIDLELGENGRFCVTLTTLDSMSHPFPLVVLEFWNYFLDKTCELRLNTH